MDEGTLEVRHRLPFSDLTSLNSAERESYMADMQPLEFGHTLTHQIGGQLAAGFLLAGFYEDGWPDHLLSTYTPVFLATRAIKPIMPING
jgi:hypothetical protein